MLAESRRKNLRRKRADQAVEIGYAGAEGDQREHVEIARHQRLPAAHEERPAGPSDHGGRENKLDPVRQGWVDEAVTADEMATHLQHDRRHGERKPDPEAPCHVGEFGIGRRVQADDIRLQRHAADRAASRTGLSDLGMHRTGVDCAFGHVLLRRARFEIDLGIGGKLGLAASRAEMKGFAAVFEAMLAGGRIDGHPADGIAHRDWGVARRMVMAATAAWFRRGAVRIGFGFRLLVVLARSHVHRGLQPIPCRGI